MYHRLQKGDGCVEFDDCNGGEEIHIENYIKLDGNWYETEVDKDYIKRGVYDIKEARKLYKDLLNKGWLTEF